MPTLLRGFIAIAAAIAMTRCTAVHPERGRQVWVESAVQCDSRKCTKAPKPTAIQLHVGHEHELNIARTDPLAEIETKFTVNDIVRPPEVTDTRPEGTTMRIKAEAVGGTTLNIELKNSEQQIIDRAFLKIQTYSSRVTVVGWVNGDAIDLKTVAQDASDDVRAQFSGDGPCALALAEIALRSPFSKDLSFIDPQSADNDLIYAQAFLVKSSANRPPDENIDEVLQRRDFRLLNDFQAMGEEGRPFAKLLHHEAIVGETPPPCGAGEQLRNWNGRVRDGIDINRPDRSEVHRRNGERIEPKGRIAQLNQGRLGWLGRQIQATLSRSTRPPDELTPWIWSVIAFDENGRFVMENAGFPTYSVYIDGKLVETCGTKQASFTDFLKRDASSRFNLEVATLDFERGGCP